MIKTSLPMLFGASILMAACVSNPALEKTARDAKEKKEFKHELVQNKFGCWEFERHPEYVPNFGYGDAMFGVGGTYIECMKSAIERHRRAAISIAENLATIPEGAPDAEKLRRRLAEESETAGEAAKIYADWRRRNWK